MISDKELNRIIINLTSRNDLDWVNLSKHCNSEVIDLLQELKQRRESDLRPATKFLNLKIGEQLRIVEGELDEVFNALPAYLIEKDDGVTGITESLMHFAEEIVDTQTALETLLVIAGLDETARNEVRRRVIEKNAKRGYYEGEKK